MHGQTDRLAGIVTQGPAWLPRRREEGRGFPVAQGSEGEEPEVFKPFPEVGSGVFEIIVSAEGGWYRVMYVAKFEEAIYVLHCFQKKTNRTSAQDKAIADARYRAILKERAQE